MRSSLFLAVCGFALLGFSNSALSQDAKPAEGFNLVFLGDQRPILLRMHIEVNGKPIKTVWTEYLKKWFDYLDRDGDGKLDAKEVQYAPRDQAMLQLMRQGNLFFQGGKNQPLRMADFNKDGNDKLTFADFAAYYEIQRVGAIQVTGSFGGQFYNPTGDALFKLLDKNGDGKLSKEELADAANVLMKLDTNDDEYVAAAEIVPGNNPQMGLGFGQLAFVNQQPGQASKSFYPVHAPADAGLAALLLATYDRDKNGKLSRTEGGLPKEIFDRVDANKDGELDLEELARWHQRPADFAFTVRLGKSDAATIELMPVPEKKLAKAASKTGDSQLISLGDSQIQVLRDNGQRAVMAIRFANNLTQIFRLADTKKQGFLTLKELQENRQFQFLSQIFPLVDKDGDGKLTEKELKEYMELQGGAADCYASLAIAEHGRNLFKLLDANGDGRLSLREMKTAWQRLKHLDLNDDGCIDLSELSRQFQLMFDQGGQSGGRQFLVVGGRQPGLNPAPAPVYGPKTPLWFKKMDRNGDGDVSFREFLGTREEFIRIDADGDGLISAEEAEQYEAKMRVKK